MSKRTDELKRLYPKGCGAPPGYYEWHCWAEAQGLHGLRQSNCVKCGRYIFPQQATSQGFCSDQVECAVFVKKHGKLQLAAIS